jgi:hypothetical protein
MAPHQQRVVEELEQLRERRDKLGLFWQNPLFKALPTDEQERMGRQFDIMVQYERVLQERIDHFPAS